MYTTDAVKMILANYESDNPGVKTNLARIMMSGELGGTGKLIILPVDQGFEHGPDASFSANPDAYDPDYHFSLAIEAGLSAYAAPLGMLEASASKFAGQIPTILKMNSSNYLVSKNRAPNQAVTASVKDALRLGCSGVGFTIYPGSDSSFNMMEEIRSIAEEAKSAGLVVVIWSYPRGGIISKEGETYLDVTTYAAHIAALLGAHIIKVKLPIARVELDNTKRAFPDDVIEKVSQSEMVKHIVRSCFNGKRIVVFSGGISKSTQEVLNETKAIKEGCGNGSIIGRNSFQRPRSEAIELLKDMIAIYKS